MTKSRKAWVPALRGLASFGLAGAALLGAFALTSAPAAARPPGGPLCGYTTLWTCTHPDGSTTVVAGTVCQISAYQKATGATCVPGGF